MDLRGYVTDIEKESLENEDFRKVLFTDDRVQLVVMSLRPKEDIGQEVHELDQVIHIVAGAGKAILGGEEHPLRGGSVVVVPQGTSHNIINSSSDHPFKLYTLYAPPNHKDGTVHKTKADAEAAEATEHLGAAH